MSLEFKCEHCDSYIYANYLKIGEKAKCKHCGEKTIITKNSKIVSEFSIPEKDRNTVSNDNKPIGVGENVAGKNIEDKYPALNFISFLLKFISILSVVLSVIIFYVVVQNAPWGAQDEYFLSGLPFFILSIVSAICIYGYGELITLFIDVEKNTRKTK